MRIIDGYQGGGRGGNGNWRGTNRVVPSPSTPAPYPELTRTHAAAAVQAPQHFEVRLYSGKEVVRTWLTAGLVSTKPVLAFVPLNETDRVYVQGTWVVERPAPSRPPETTREPTHKVSLYCGGVGVKEWRTGYIQNCNDETAIFIDMNTNDYVYVHGSWVLEKLTPA